MGFTSEWEDFHVYTNHTEDEDFVDNISINVKRKEYILDIEVSDFMLDSFDYDAMVNEGKEIYYESTKVSREIFDIIVAGVKEKGFKRLVREETDGEDD